jgi:membrane protein implicated in regulation of membrane protease activity
MMISAQVLGCFSWLGSAWLPVVIFLGLVALVLLYVGLRAQSRPKCTGEEEMIGTTGIVRRTAGFRGRSTVEIRGEIWWCRSRYRLARDMEVTVTGIKDMILEVEPVSGDGEGI